jgi:hypothetical protein
MKLSFLFSFVDEFTKERKNVLKDPWRSSYCSRVVSGGTRILGHARFGEEEPKLSPPSTTHNCTVLI